MATGQEIAIAFLEAGQMDKRASYLSRGRAFQALSDDQLAERIAAAFTGMVADPLDADKYRMVDDLSSEFRVRGKEPPLPSWDELERMRVLAREASEIPEAMEAAEDDMRDFIECLTNPMKKS